MRSIPVADRKRDPSLYWYSLPDKDFFRVAHCGLLPLLWATDPCRSRQGQDSCGRRQRPSAPVARTNRKQTSAWSPAEAIALRLRQAREKRLIEKSVDYLK